MVFKALRSGRPSTSAGNKRYSTFDPPDATRSHSSLDKGHKKIGSLHRLSLSFSPSKDGHLAPFLSPEPEPEHNLTQSPNDPAVPDFPSPVVSPEPSQLDLIHEPPSTPPTGTDMPPHSEANEEDEPTPRPPRFSLMKFRHASEPQLSTRYRETEADDRPPPPTPPQPPPQIITTAPTQQMDVNADTPTTSRETFKSRSFSSFRKSQLIKDPLPQQKQVPGLMSEMDGARSTPNLQRHNSHNRPPQIQEEDASSSQPPAYGDESASALAIPVPRLSDSSQGSSGSHQVYAKTTTTHVVSTTTTFFKLKRNKDKTKVKERKRKNKDKGLLFPLPEDLAPSSSRTSESRYSGTPLAGRDSMSPSRTSMSPSRKSTQNIRWVNSVGAGDSPAQSPSTSATALTNAPLPPHVPAVARKHSTLSNRSGASSPSTTLIPPRPGVRGRSSTLGSLSRSSERLHEHLAPSGRTSTSTAGRISFGDILSLSQRLRQNSAPPRHDSNNSGSTPASKSNSFQIAREPEPELVYPQREEADTPASYLEKLEAAVPRGAMATILCKYGDDFSKTCLRKYMRGFSYFGESIDMAIRKMLMEVILPKETQQIDRLLQGFADRYHECNPGVFINSDEANFVAFSILLLQSDSHNKNNKRKMTKQDYVKNTQNGRISVAESILECFFDNICYTPFIHFDDDIAVNNHRLATPKTRKTLMRSKSSENLKGPIDPYALILDNKLDMLRPPLKDALETEDTYSTVGTADSVYTAANHKAFVRSAVLQIVSARSRPDAFMTQATISNPAEAQAGLVSIKVAKVGLLWRKSIKKKKGKSPWQEWGAILTDSKLYFFKDVSWVKKLIAQYDAHAVKVRSAPLVFKPPVTSFAPDALMAMDDAVALIDSSYKRHKHAFTFIKHGGFEEVFLANSEGDMEDWIGKVNYAATFRTAGVRMRGLLGTNYEGRQMLRKDSELSNLTLEDSSQHDKDTSHMAWEIMFYRRQLVSEKISSFDDHVASAQKELDYLLRNARHLVILLPIQQKTRETLVSAAGRMNAKLKWTRKEIWRAKTHRDILIKDLEAEATSAFPAPPVVASTAATTPIKTTPTKARHEPLLRTETDQTNDTQPSTSAGSPPVRRPSQAVLEQIQTDNSDGPELLIGRRKSLASITAASPKGDLEVTDDKVSVTTGPTAESHSLHAVPSDTILQQSREIPSEVDMDEEAGLKNAGLLPINTNSTTGQPTQLRRGSETSRERGHGHNLAQTHHSHSESMKDRASNVRRSLQRTLRDGNHHVHIPHHTHSRGKRGKESGSSLGVTSDGDSRSVISGDGSHESQELRRDPTGRFVLHGKKASVITMGPEWSLSSEDRMKLREQAMANEEIAMEEDSDARGKPLGMRIDTDVDNDFARDGQGIGQARNSANLSVYSALTSAPRESFHSAHSSRRESNASI